MDHAKSPDSIGTVRRERVVVIGLVAALTALRSLVFVVFEGAHFDSDQALVGVMAKHLIEGRAFPVFLYVHPYMLGVQAWMAAPFFLIGGATVPMLKAPLFIINIAIAVLLVVGLERWAGLRPWLAAVPALYFVLAPPGTATALLEAFGANPEPFLMALLLWMIRRRPLLFGAVLAFAVLHREFSIYAAGALVTLRLLDGSWRAVSAWRPVALSAAAFAAVWQAVYLLKQFSSVDGPGTAVRAAVGAGANVGTVVNHICLAPGLLASGISAVLGTHIASLLGAERRPLVEYGLNSHLAQGIDGFWIVLGGGFLAMLGRLVWLAWRRGFRPWHPPYEFPTYLFLIGAQALAVYALLRCGVVSTGTMRYSLLGVLSAVGLTAAYLRAESSSRLRAAAIALTLLWAASSVTDHLRLAREYTTDRPVNARRLLADRLDAEGVRVAYADFWDALSIVFLTNERVIVASTNVVFVEEYQWIVRERSDEAWRIQRSPCPVPGGIDIEGWLFACPPPGWTRQPPAVR